MFVQTHAREAIPHGGSRQMRDNVIDVQPQYTRANSKPMDMGYQDLRHEIRESGSANKTGYTVDQGRVPIHQDSAVNAGGWYHYWGNPYIRHLPSVETFTLLIRATRVSAGGGGERVLFKTGTGGVAQHVITYNNTFGRFQWYSEVDTLNDFIYDNWHGGTFSHVNCYAFVYEWDGAAGRREMWTNGRATRLSVTTGSSPLRFSSGFLRFGTNANTVWSNTTDWTGSFLSVQLVPYAASPSEIIRWSGNPDAYTHGRAN